MTEVDHPGVLARAWCARTFACECDSVHADEDACATDTEGMVDRRAATYRDMGLTYDATCASAIVHEIEVVGCRGYRPVELGCGSCALYHGDLAQGEPCAAVGVGATPCVRGLLCLAATTGAPPTCEDPCVVLPRFVAIGEACATAQCDPLGGLCVDGVCTSFPAAGETCDRGNCERSAYCDDTDVCVASLPRGASCTEGIECETRFCDAGTCVSFCGPRPF